MSKLKVQAPGTVSKVSTLKDGSIQLTVETMELPPEQMSILFELRKSMGWFLFAAEELNEEDIPEETVEIKDKSPSQRLRNVLYVYWEQEGKKGTFTQFYNTQMERLIESVKEKLD